MIGPAEIKDANMEITIDGKAVSIDTGSISTFSDLIHHIEETHVVSPDVITRIVLNESELDQGQEIGLGGFPVTDIDSLVISTANTLELAHESLSDSQEYLPALAQILEESAATIREGNIREGLQQASEALEIISSFGEVLDSIRGAFHIDFAQVRIDDFTLLDKLLDLNRHAGEVLKAVQDEEWTHFADLIEYELSPLLYEWMAVIPELVKLLPRSGSETPPADEDENIQRDTD